MANLCRGKKQVKKRQKNMDQKSKKVSFFWESNPIPDLVTVMKPKYCEADSYFEICNGLIDDLSFAT